MRLRCLLLSLTGVWLLGGTGCVARALFTDGSSVSLGKPSRGVLRGGRALPDQGDGYVVPPLWRARGNRFGTDELVAAIARAARAVDGELPGGTLAIGDLSRRGGGGMPFHKSHESGRDADLIFYAVDEDGAPATPVDAMPRYDRHLRAQRPYDGPPVAIPTRYFDLPRNWELVKALLTDGGIDVEYLFISRRLRERLLDYAREIAEPEPLVRRAAVALRQPARALPHDDHLHLRIRCSADDASQGCVEDGAVRLRSETWRDPARTLARGGAPSRRHHHHLRARVRVSRRFGRRSAVTG